MPWTKTDRKNSFACNGDLVRTLRRSKGLSQSQLSDLSGYSVRLISKAEAGNRVTLATLEVLAQALSTPERTVATEELISGPIQIAKLFTDAIHGDGTKAFSRIRAFLTDDVVFSISGDPNEFSYAGIHQGIDNVELAVTRLFSEMTIPEEEGGWEAHYQFFQSDETVVIWGRCRMHRIGEEPGSPVPVTQRLKFRDGKICFFEDRFDPADGP